MNSRRRFDDSINLLKLLVGSSFVGHLHVMAQWITGNGDDGQPEDVDVLP